MNPNFVENFNLNIYIFSICCISAGDTDVIDQNVVILIKLLSRIHF